MCYNIFMTSRKINLFQNLKSMLGFWFSYHSIDEHYVVKFFGIKFCKKHDIYYNFKEVTESGVTSVKRSPRLVVSLTTYPARINIVYKTISTLMTQSLKADEIVLWLAESQFPEKKLPENLTRLCEYGLSIKWCDDIKSFKKLIPSLKEYPEDIIVTVDDDNYYDSRLLEKLYNEYKSRPDCIHARQAFVIKKQKGRFALKSRNYDYNNSYLPSYSNEPVGCGGVLYPPHALHPNVLNEQEFMEIIPTNDDIWFWGHAVRNGTKINVIKDNYKLKMYVIEDSQSDSLWSKNMRNTTVGLNGNDAVNMMYERFEEIRTNLDSEF